MVYMTGKDFNEIMFSEYPDVVGLKDLTKMLGIGRNTALSLLQKQKILQIKEIKTKNMLFSYKTLL